MLVLIWGDNCTCHKSYQQLQNLAGSLYSIKYGHNHDTLQVCNPVAKTSDIKKNKKTQHTLVLHCAGSNNRTTTTWAVREHADCSILRWCTTGSIKTFTHTLCSLGFSTPKEVPMNACWTTLRTERLCETLADYRLRRAISQEWNNTGPWEHAAVTTLITVTGHLLSSQIICSRLASCSLQTLLHHPLHQHLHTTFGSIPTLSNADFPLP